MEFLEMILMISCMVAFVHVAQLIKYFKQQKLMDIHQNLGQHTINNFFHKNFEMEIV